MRRPDTRAGSRASLGALLAGLLALLLPVAVLGADWSTPRRVTPAGGSRLDSLHQVAVARKVLHLAHPRIGPGLTDDRVVYQRSTDGGATWSRERTLFSATSARRDVVPNLAVASRGDIVAVAWRVNGPAERTLFVRVSRDRGLSFAPRQEVFSTRKGVGVGVPAVAVGDGVIAVAWTNRANGKVKVSTSRDQGRTFTSGKTLARTKLSIDCRKRVTDGLVGIAANGRSIHVAWSHAPKRKCLADQILVRTSLDRGRTWSKRRTITNRRSYGWPELDARARTVVATVQSPNGGIIVARSGKNGRDWSDRILRAPKRHSFSAADIVLLPDGKAMLTHVDERIRKDRLVSTKVVSRRSTNDGRTWRSPNVVVPVGRKLRMAPNIEAIGTRVTIVVQMGPLAGATRNLFASRLR